jgi:ketosteroid isomerase-like protein
VVHRSTVRARINPFAVALVVLWSANHLLAAQGSPGPVLEIRTYTLKPGTRAEFHRCFEAESLPLLRRWNIDVVGYGPSQHDEDSYILIRAFRSVAERERIENAFYAGAEWQQGPRAAVLAAIDTYTTVVIRVDESTVEGVRRTMNTTSSIDDHATLLRLNDEYVASVEKADVERFGEILAPDFLCTLPDGTLVDRAEFLERTAKPSGLREIRAHDVQVRVMGDVAIVHARTTFAFEDGRRGTGRYTDVWARRDGVWLAVAAHVTRNRLVSSAMRMVASGLIVGMVVLGRPASHAQTLNVWPGAAFGSEA